MKAKSYTDLEQSKKLAEILPLDTADMHYNNLSVRGVNYVDSHHADLMPYMDAVKTLSGYSNVNPLFEVIPCWSLAALLDVIPKHIGYNTLGIDIGEKDFFIWYDEFGCGVNTELPDIKIENSVDACYEMIIKLNELKLL